jgi:hypothetical protein
VALPTAINSQVAIAIFQTRLRIVSLGCHWACGCAAGSLKTELAMSFTLTLISNQTS